MRAKRASDLAKGLIVDVDGAIAGDPRDPAARHSAAASAAILATRLFGGLCINLARIAAAAERIADTMEDESEAPKREDGPEDRGPMAD
jgi:hypothetical protein